MLYNELHDAFIGVQARRPTISQRARGLLNLAYEDTLGIRDENSRLPIGLMRFRQSVRGLDLSGAISKRMRSFSTQWGRLTVRRSASRHLPAAL